MIAYRVVKCGLLAAVIVAVVTAGVMPAAAFPSGAPAAVIRAPARAGSILDVDCAAYAARGIPVAGLRDTLGT